MLRSHPILSPNLDISSKNNSLDTLFNDELYLSHYSHQAEVLIELGHPILSPKGFIDIDQ